MNKALIIMCGLTCVGKSTLAERLRKSLHFELVGTDDVRTKIFRDANQSISHPLERYVVYFFALKYAGHFLSKSRGVIVDGTFCLRTFRQGAYYLAQTMDVPIYVVEVYCNNLSLIRKGFERRKQNNPYFDKWADINSYFRKIQEFEALEKEALPDGRPIPIIRYNSENGKAEIVFSDGSEIIERIVEAIRK